MAEEIPKGKYNKWCERNPLVSSDGKKILEANRHLVNSTLSNYKKWIWFTHELVDCNGIEFVAFSNIKSPTKISFSDGLVLVPCFEAVTEGKSLVDPLVQKSIEMRRRARYIYDGWMPLDNWSIENMRNKIVDINQNLSLFALQGRNWFQWEPKYLDFKNTTNISLFTDEHFHEIFELISYINELDHDDKTAILRSAAWLSQSMQITEPAGRFLFCFVALESLITYIENSKNDSLFFNFKKVRKMNKKQKKECIQNKIATLLHKNSVKTIERAYFECVKGIGKTLRGNIRGNFGEESKMYQDLFKEKIDGSTLYGIRQDIAHGGLHAFDERTLHAISLRIYDIENITRTYILTMLRKLMKKEIFEVQTKTSMFLNMGILSNRGMYKGPVHMAYLYS